MKGYPLGNDIRSLSPPIVCYFMIEAHPPGKIQKEIFPMLKDTPMTLLNLTAFW